MGMEICVIFELKNDWLLLCLFKIFLILYDLFRDDGFIYNIEKILNIFFFNVSFLMNLFLRVLNIF